MATVLQHQVESRVNDLYRKLGAHANIIMRLSVELDRIRSDNEEMKEIIMQDRQQLRSLRNSVANANANSQPSEPSQSDNPAEGSTVKKKLQLDDISTKPNEGNIDDEFQNYCNKS